MQKTAEAPAAVWFGSIRAAHRAARTTTYDVAAPPRGGCSVVCAQRHVAGTIAGKCRYIAAKVPLACHAGDAGQRRSGDLLIVAALPSGLTAVYWSVHCGLTGFNSAHVRE